MNKNKQLTNPGKQSSAFKIGFTGLKKSYIKAKIESKAMDKDLTRLINTS